MTEAPLISVENLTRFYKVGEEEVRALDGVSFDVRRGEWVAVVGQSGSGKSTLMNLIGALDTATGGSYRINGHDVEKMSDDELADLRNNEIGFVFQTFQLLSRSTALANVELPLVYRGIPRKERKEKAVKALEAVGLANRMHHKPNELSGGQRQRVAIARALINNPGILLADEPTGNLDSVTGQDIMQLFGRLHEQGQTIILVTHEHDIAEHASRVVTLRDGLVSSDVRNGVQHTPAAAPAVVAGT